MAFDLPLSMLEAILAYMISMIIQLILKEFDLQ